MKLKVLGCSGGIGGRHLRTTSLLVDNDILVDDYDRLSGATARNGGFVGVKVQKA